MENNNVIFVNFTHKNRYKRKKHILLFLKNLKKTFRKLFNKKGNYTYSKKITNIN